MKQANNAEFVFSEIVSVQQKRAEEATPERKQRLQAVKERVQQKRADRALQ